MDRMYAAPPPRKVRRGRLDGERMEIETMGGETVHAPYASVRCIFVGRMEPAAPASGPSLGELPSPSMSGRGGRLGKISVAISLGEGPTGASAAMARSAYSVIDVYVEGHEAPLRFETAGTNMRTLLGDEAGYSGDLNHLALLGRLARLAPHAVHRSAAEVLEGGRSAIRSYPSREDLYLASRKALKSLENAPRAPLSPPGVSDVLPHPGDASPAPPSAAAAPPRPTMDEPLSPPAASSTATWSTLPPAFQPPTPAFGPPAAPTMPDLPAQAAPETAAGSTPPPAFRPPTPAFNPPPAPTFGAPRTLPAPTFGAPQSSTFGSDRRAPRDLFSESREAERYDRVRLTLLAAAAAILAAGGLYYLGLMR